MVQLCLRGPVNETTQSIELNVTVGTNNQHLTCHISFSFDSFI
jgi:hypothetical protein